MGLKNPLRVIAVMLVLACIGATFFAVMTVRAFTAFAQYRHDSLGTGPRVLWSGQGDKPSVEQCVTSVYTWAVDCVGISTLCQVKSHELLMQCLDEDQRVAYCQAREGGMQTTGYGYQHCEELVASHTGPTQSPWRAEKICAGLYRLVAGHCFETLAAKKIK